MASKKKQQRLVLSKEAEGTLSAAEILHRESEYRKQLTDYKKGLIAGEKFKYKGIQKLAQELEKAGTVEKHKISARIKQDLKSLIENKLLSISYVGDSLEDEYKQLQYISSVKGENPPISTEESKTREEIDVGKEEAQDNQETEEDTPVKSPVSVQEELDHDEQVDEQYHFIRGLTELVTGLKEEELLNANDNFKLIEETKKYRFGIVKRLDDLNLKTLYQDARRLALVWNDYIKQLDDEVGVRQAKGELLSE